MTVIAAALSIVIILTKRIGSLQTGKSLKAALFRLFALSVWFLSFYGFYFLNQLIIFFLTSNFEAYDFLFPISYGVWISQPFSAKHAILNLFYLGVFFLAFGFALRELSKENVVRHYVGAGSWRIRTGGKLAALIAKDLKQLYRNPQLLLIFLLPVYVSLMHSILLSEIAGIIFLQALLPVTISTLMSLEGNSYILSLPITEWDVKISKILVGVAVYAISVVVVLAFAAYRGNIFNVLALFPTGFAVILTVAQLYRNVTGEVVNVEAVIATFFSFILVVTPAAVGGIAVLIKNAPFATYAFPVSLAEALLIFAAFAAVNWRS
ncbi:MAG: hypothetical protein ABWW66_03945 [Archaeoglobaceae archaeon]